MQFVVALAASFLLLTYAGRMPMLHVAGAGFYVAVSLAGVGGVFESARWAGPMETARLAVLAAVAVVLGDTGAIPLALAVAAAAFCIVSTPFPGSSPCAAR